MFDLISKIHNTSNAYGYVPVITETSGLIAVAAGVGSLGVSGILKGDEYYTGQKTAIPYISSDAAQFYAESGKTFLMYGFKRLVPTTGVLLTTYVLFGKCRA